MNEDAFEIDIPSPQMEVLDPLFVEPVSKALDQIFEESIRLLRQDSNETMAWLDEREEAIINFKVKFYKPVFVGAEEGTKGEAEISMTDDLNESYELEAPVHKSIIGYDIMYYELFRLNSSDPSGDSREKILTLNRGNNGDVIKIHRGEDPKEISFMLFDRAAKFISDEK